MHLKRPYPTSGEITAHVTGAGEFRGSQIIPGTCTLRVLDSFGREIVSRSVQRGAERFVGNFATETKAGGARQIPEAHRILANVYRMIGDGAKT